jgi:FADH2 O2-dependent halogenase
MYDVAILGSGIGGSILACILAKRGIKTLLIEELSHPRFAIGESLIPETGVRLRILAEKHGVPEIGWMGSFHALRDNVSSNCGVKRAFSFMYHRKNERHHPDEVNQLPTLTPPFGPDSHLFRQDTDAWLAAIAAQYGADFRQQLKIEGIRFENDHVELRSSKGEVFRTSFLIDAGGMRSLVSTQLKLRDDVPRFRTDTRAIYNHFIGLKSADLLLDPPGSHRMPSPLGQGTMHHVFDGGWMWLIPFNNHRDATNPLTSVGLMLDRRKHPTPVGAPAEEFTRIISEYPTIARQFVGATAVRPWIGSGRIQYSSPHLLAPRMLQLPHAADFVDPLYSSGMSVLTVAIDLIADALLEAVAENDYAVERFQLVEDVVNRGFDHYDTIVARSFDAFASYDLFNAWNRNWVMGNFLGTFGPLALLVRYLATGDKSWLAKTTEPSRIGVLGSHLPDVLAAMKTSEEVVASAVSGNISHREASAQIFAHLGSLNFLPPYMGFGRPEQRALGTFTLQAGARHVLWYGQAAPEKWREYCTFPLTTYALQVAGCALGAMGDGLRRSWSVVRDVFSAGNDEWRHVPSALRCHPELALPISELDAAELENPTQLSAPKRDAASPRAIGTG